MHVRGRDRPDLKGHTSGPLLLHWQQHDPVARKEAGKSSPNVPKRTEQLKLSATVSVHFNLFSFQMFSDCLLHTKLCAKNSLRTDWAASCRREALNPQKERRYGGKCPPSQEKRKRERLLDVHRVILDWKVPGDDRIRTLLSKKNRTLVGEAGTGAWKQGL